MVLEGVVLLWVKHLEHRRGGIATPVGRHLVDLIKQNNRVDNARLLHALDDATGHGANVRAAVTANLGFIAHPTEAHAHELAVQCSSDTLTEAGLADARRTHQAQDRGAKLEVLGLVLGVLITNLSDVLAHFLRELTHGQKLEDALLDLI